MFEDMFFDTEETLDAGEDNGPQCMDTNNGLLDRSLDGCDWYVATPGHCGGEHDTDDFSVQEMCCTCGGGQQSVCRNTNGDFTDSAADGCEWYDANEGHCGGEHDTDNFFVAEMCCSCNGGTFDFEDEPEGVVYAYGTYSVALAQKTDLPESNGAIGTETFFFGGVAMAALAFAAYKGVKSVQKKTAATIPDEFERI